MRIPRIEYTGAMYHAYTRGDNKENIFLTNRDRESYLNTLRLCKERYEFELYAYCLMANHVHLVLRTGEAPLSHIMHLLNSRYSKHFNRAYTRVGHVFQGRYQANLIEGDAGLLEATRYVHLNPVVIGLVKSPSQYRWSSMRAYLKAYSEHATDLVDTSFVLSMVGKRPEVQRTRYQIYIQEGVIRGRGKRQLMRAIAHFRSIKPGS